MMMSFSYGPLLFVDRERYTNQELFLLCVEQYQKILFPCHLDSEDSNKVKQIVNKIMEVCHQK